MSLRTFWQLVTVDPRLAGPTHGWWHLVSEGVVLCGVSRIGLPASFSGRTVSSPVWPAGDRCPACSRGLRWVE